VHLHSQHVTLDTRGAVIDVTDIDLHNPTEWCDYTGTDVRDGEDQGPFVCGAARGGRAWSGGAVMIVLLLAMIAFLVWACVSVAGECDEEREQREHEAWIAAMTEVAP
jgi:hypothetical protein